MSKMFWAAIGLLILNVMIVLYERGSKFFSWRLYISIAVLMLLAALFPEVIAILLLAILVTNLFRNTSKIRRLINK